MPRRPHKDSTVIPMKIGAPACQEMCTDFRARGRSLGNIEGHALMSGRQVQPILPQLEGLTGSQFTGQSLSGGGTLLGR